MPSHCHAPRAAEGHQGEVFFVWRADGDVGGAIAVNVGADTDLDVLRRVVQLEPDPVMPPTLGSVHHGEIRTVGHRLVLLFARAHREHDAAL